MKIKLLDNETIQKIAAGEVVERPASIIRELVENSIDAGANQINVQIKNGGKSYIKVSDNGTGIAKDDVEMAFLRHATSKISSFEDLYDNYTMGFRGEALASIIAVSQLSVYTKVDKESSGTYLVYKDNKLFERKSIAMNTGTSIEVTGLFNSLPVRKKFLGSDISEANKITSIMYKLAISRPDIGISYIKDDREIFSTLATNSLEDNLRVLFNQDYVNNSIEISASNINYEIGGFISNSHFYKANRSMQYIFVNDRYIESPDLVKVIEKQYLSLIPSGRFPAFQIFIKTKAKNIDINISPNKQKIKFNNEEDLLFLIESTIRKSLFDTQEAKKIRREEGYHYPNFYNLQAGDSYKNILDAYKNIGLSLEEENSKEYPSQKENHDTSDSIEIIDLDSYIEDVDRRVVNPYTNDDEQISLDKNLTGSEDNKNNDYLDMNKDLGNKSYQQTISQSFKEDRGKDGKEILKKYQFIAKIFNKYLMFKNNYEDTLLIVDQRAAFERLIYDELSERLDNNKLKTNKLLSPIIIELSKKDMITVNNRLDVYQDLGLDVDLFGEDSLAIRSVPYIGELPADRDFILSLIDDLSREANIDKHKEIFKRRAMSASLSKNRSLGEKEVYALLSRLNKSSNPFTNEHGRKIQFTMDLTEFERILNR